VHPHKNDHTLKLTSLTHPPQNTNSTPTSEGRKGDSRGILRIPAPLKAEESRQSRSENPAFFAPSKEESRRNLAGKSKICGPNIQYDKDELFLAYVLPNMNPQKRFDDAIDILQL
jgi:hypothetical protein